MLTASSIYVGVINSMESDEMEEFFKPVVEQIICHIEKQLKNARNRDCCHLNVRSTIPNIFITSEIAACRWISLEMWAQESEVEEAFLGQKLLEVAKTTDDDGEVAAHSGRRLR